MEKFAKYGISIPNVLLPKNIDVSTWSVVACDQYTQDKNYWQKVQQIVGSKNSTLNIILPEVYLEDSDKDERIQKVKSTMNSYIEQNVFDSEKQEFIYVERVTAYNRTRKGLVACIDLDCYEWKPFSNALIRATEATILERIPPRMQIRRDAPIESPHIMILVNDKNHLLVEGTGKKIKSKNIDACYKGTLMQNSGSITGYPVCDKESLDYVLTSLEQIAKENTDENKNTFMFAVGDGNHSLATAKAIWDEVKLNNGGKKNDDGTISIPSGWENHNARYALIEIVNIFDEGLTFEPIHRVIFNANKDELIKKIAKSLEGKITEVSSKDELCQRVKNSTANFGFVYKNSLSESKSLSNTNFINDNSNQKYILLETKIKELAIARIQPVIDEFLDENKSATIDYIHGTDEVFRLANQEDAITILNPPIAKESFFATINGRGPLPRKSFSMGEADEKRFYLECRKLF